MKHLLINDKLYWNTTSWTLLQFCFLSYIENIPRFCYHEQLTVAGNCRMCLIEDLKSLKPVVSCTIIPLDNSVFYTTSIKVKKARESMLEFLLINHPLDCPICCQGGECDLQDLTEIVGSDRGRYYENKRAVIDKNLGPIVKTSMNRCIHCTRCVRFSIEIANNYQLGLLGRGNNIEIGTYLEIFLSHEFQGNLIDICPVGALTSKLYAYFIRAWECENYLIPNIFDIFLDNIRIEIRGNKIIRILPVYNIYWKNEWLSDFSRYLTEHIYSIRFKTPMFKLQLFFLRCSWVLIFTIIKLYFFNSINWLIYNKIKYIELFSLSNEFINFSTYTLVLLFIKQLSLYNSIYTRYYNKDSIISLKIDLQSFFQKITNSYIFIFAKYFRWKYPQLYLSLNNHLCLTTAIKHIFFYENSNIISTTSSNVSLKQLYFLLSGKNFLSLFINKDKTIFFFSILNKLLKNWYKNLSCIFLNPLTNKIFLYQLNNEHIESHNHQMNNYQYSNTLKVIYTIERDNLLFLNSSKILYIYQNSFVNKMFNFANIYLPTTFGYEELLSFSSLNIIKKMSNLYLLSNGQLKQVKKIVWTNTNIQNSEDICISFQNSIEFFNNQNSLNLVYLLLNDYKIYQFNMISSNKIFLSLFKHYIYYFFIYTIHSDLLKYTFNTIFNNQWIKLLF